MISLIILTLIFAIFMILLSFLANRLEIKLLFPVAFTFISIGLFIISFIVGEWGGMGLGAVSIAVFIASLIALIGIVILNQVCFKE